MSVELNNFVGNDFRLCRCSVAHVKCCWWTTNSCRLCDLCRRFHLEKKLYVTIKMFLLRASKIEESVVLVLQVLKPETEIFFTTGSVLYVRSDISYYYILFNKHSKTMGWYMLFSTSRFKHTNLGVLKFNLPYVK